MNKKTKFTVFGLASILAVGVTVGVSIMPKELLVPSAQEAYTLTINKAPMHETYDYYLTNLNNEIKVNTTGTTAKLENGVVTLNKDATFENVTPISGLARVVVDYTVDGVAHDNAYVDALDIEIGYQVAKDNLTPAYKAKHVFAKDWYFGNDAVRPAFLRFSAKVDKVEIKSITYEYSCKASYLASGLTDTLCYITGVGSFTPYQGHEYQSYNGLAMNYDESTGQFSLENVSFKQGDKFDFRMGTVDAERLDIKVQAQNKEANQGALESRAITQASGTEPIVVTRDCTLNIYVKKHENAAWITRPVEHIKDWYVIGDFNNWDDKTMVPMVDDPENEGCVYANVEMYDGDCFKIRTVEGYWQNKLYQTAPDKAVMQNPSDPNSNIMMKNMHGVLRIRMNLETLNITCTLDHQIQPDFKE